MKTARSEVFKWLVRLISAEPATLGDALFQVGWVAHRWPRLRSDERAKLKATSIGHAGLVEQRKCRATGFLVGLYKTVDQASQQEADEAGRYSVVCEEHIQPISATSVVSCQRKRAHTVKKSAFDGPIAPPCGDSRCGHKHYLHHNGGSTRAQLPGCDVSGCKCVGYKAPRKTLDRFKK